MNTQLQSILAKRIAKRNIRKDGFTLIELMVVVAIVGVLTAVGLPQLTKAQDKAKGSAAKAELVNFSKSCSIALVTGAAVPVAADFGNSTGTCAASSTLANTGGNESWEVAIDASGVTGVPTPA